MSPQKPHPLDEIFHPKNIAVIGASASGQGTGWVARLLHFGYSGHIYPINPRATEINGLKAYPTLRDVPSPIDYAIFNIPARLAPQMMRDCVTKGVKAAHIYTAGFSEIGKEEGKKLEAQVAAIAREGGVRVIGPNCMGIYCPAGGVTFNDSFSKEPGNIAFVSQTGAGANRFIPLANNRGIRFSKVISYGNAIDLDSPDFLEYLADDDETKIITCYIEGVRDGRRFLAAIRKCLLMAKPVIILKSGLTESGAGAAASHTASLAGSAAIWDSFFKQTGVIRVNTLEEIADIILVLQHMPCPKGRRVGLIGRGGGFGVIATDICERAGLKVPPFLPATRNQLEKIAPEAGSGVRNPVEGPLPIGTAADFFYPKGLKLVDADPKIDFILVRLDLDVYGRRDEAKLQLAKVIEIIVSTAQTLTKPIVIIITTGESLRALDAGLASRERLLQAGIPVYFTIETAANAVSKLIGFHEFAEKVKSAG